MGSILIYGANGYSGGLAAAHASERGLDAVVAGRSAEAIEAVAQRTGLPSRVFALDDASVIAQSLSGIRVVLNCAGPFSRTALPLARACLSRGVHYLDITGEIDIIESLLRLDGEAKKAGVVLMPATGFDVVPTDSVARYLVEKLPDATHLELAFMSSGGLSHGTATTMIDRLGALGSSRAKGEIVAEPIAKRITEIDFDGTKRTCASIPWGDVASAYYTTGIPNIVTYTAIPPRAAKMMKYSAGLTKVLGSKPIKKLAQHFVDTRITGPSEDARARGSSRVWGRVRNAAGQEVSCVLHTAEGYQLTYLASVDIAARVQAGEIAPGAWTPAGALGAEYILSIGDSRYVDR